MYQYRQLDLWSVAAEPVSESEAPVYDEGVPVSYLTVEECARRLGVHRQRIYEYIRSKRLKAIKDPETRTWLVSEESLESFEKKPRGRPRKNRSISV